MWFLKSTLNFSMKKEGFFVTIYKNLHTRHRSRVKKLGLRFRL
jgi:hypothetical protein